ncbi:hypothetical protein EA472_07255 [Natrarchaeobius oligotrophus]|uniref:Serine kinase n=1 Tax=Natrarchaeobius chitinivorans TaxID=1679083 RepID=A0A3N6PQD0_NATCH|nr:hypothetical protein EA472_07255 [Natrarchaeobius chitinivorans]
MTYYTAYGLTIESTFSLPELPQVEGTAEAIDVELRRDELDPVPTSVAGEGGRRIRAGPNTCRLSYDTIGTFLVEDGRRVSFDPVAEFETTPGAVPPKIVRRLFQNEMMGVLLHQRGQLVLHASAVAVDGRAAVFLGPRGAGKSTTAAAFDAAGHTILEDDVVGIRVDESHPAVLPGVPQLRLMPDAVEALDVEGTTGPASDADSEKRYKQFDAARRPAPLAACYLLEEDDSLAIDRLDPHERVSQLVSRTYTGGMLAETDATAVNFRQCTTIAKTCPFRRLRRPRDHRSLPALVEAVVDDLHSSGRTHLSHQ